MATLRSLFKRKKKVDRTWLVLSKPAEHDGAPVDDGVEPDREVMAALTGKHSLYEPEEAANLAAQTGWASYRREILALLQGERPYEAAALVTLLRVAGPVCGEDLVANLPTLTPKGRLVAVTAYPALGVTSLIEVLDRLEPEDLDAAFRCLAASGVPAARTCLERYLNHDDWRLVMRAAAALGEAGCVAALPALRKVQAGADNILHSGLAEVIKMLERDGAHGDREKEDGEDGRLDG